jgi:hypothetical protein
MTLFEGGGLGVRLKLTPAHCFFSFLPSFLLSPLRCIFQETHAATKDDPGSDFLRDQMLIWQKTIEAERESSCKKTMIQLASTEVQTDLYIYIYIYVCMYT